MADIRIRNLELEATLAGTHYIVIDNPSYNLTNAKKTTLDDVKEFVWKIITNPTIISNIKSDSNWNSDGDYIGDYTGLVAGDIYTDTHLRIRYEYDGEILIRYHINNVI